MITKNIALSYSMFYHISVRNADGSAARCRANGRCKTWKTRPNDFRLPVKHGLRNCFYITPDNAHEWLHEPPLDAEHQRIYDAAPVEWKDHVKTGGTGALIYADYLEEHGDYKSAEYIRKKLMQAITH